MEAMMKRHTAEVPFRVDPWVIRRARVSDAAALRRYFRLIAYERPNNTAIRPAYTDLTLAGVRERIERYEADGQKAMFVAVHSGQVIGYVSMTTADDPFSPHMATLSINVHVDWRGCGLGSALLRTALSWAYAQPHIERVELEALTRNDGAIRLYERHGFRLEGIFRRAYRMIDEGDGTAYVDAAHMALLIERTPSGTRQPARAQEFSAWDDHWF